MYHKTVEGLKQTVLGMQICKDKLSHMIHFLDVTAFCNENLQERSFADLPTQYRSPPMDVYTRAKARNQHEWNKRCIPHTVPLQYWN